MGPHMENVNCSFQISPKHSTIELTAAEPVLQEPNRCYRLEPEMDSTMVYEVR